MPKNNREDRVCCTRGDDFVCCNGNKEDDIKRLLRNQLEVYSYQFKQAATVFAKGQVALSGKVIVFLPGLCNVYTQYNSESHREGDCFLHSL